ncbi:pimeloyl-ACP methyl ester esterase BioH [Pseudoalteromonas sp. McH1-7]|uniref:pimeloyl-ACP methyl ester esterase BioH n=1 Tax=Pseudoalteromonas TaxID=53246 RepID=UPI0015920FDA|nr:MULTISPECIES: pimeloyl-ACP methyl ester esterase BioH [Pseudoalteromonas]MDW7551464.1 pimeloyl-ACP methyl ester esterase BioH [Pseudoalteromonas peptidolytica]NUZ13024.1 pimeloyl-ACP methyl ester esterase BioH [Pseudoalteromonas sp. McH1-7]USD28854.1 pimeloyl-ACP methyl ester esterase BioH [Pseudoalteromonas sp. SCSIO 43201]
MQNEVVFLHGWGMNKAVWQLCEATLQSEVPYTLKAINLPGFGGSSSAAGGYILEKNAELIAEQLSCQSVVVGWSLGGLFALYLAKHFPEKVSKVILVASTPLFAEKFNWPGIAPKVLNNFATQLTTNTGKTIERFLAIQAMGSEHARDDIKQLRTLLGQLPQAEDKALSGGLTILETVDLRDMFVEIEQPISGIFGRLDSLVPHAAINQMHQLNPKFESHVLPKASHAPFISHKDTFISLLKSII